MNLMWWCLTTIMSLSIPGIIWVTNRRPTLRTYLPPMEVQAMTETLQVASVHAGEAVEHARELVRKGTTDHHRLCLQFVRECWGLPARYRTAQEAWDHALVKHDFQNAHAIPFGAPVFSRRPDAPEGDSGHVFLAGGLTRNGVRIFRSTDIKVTGGISVCTLDDIRHRWGHQILGWTEDLNGYHLPLPKIR